MNLPFHPLVSIVVVTRNRRAEVVRALESCLAQDYEPLEVLVYDDASTDGTWEAVRRDFPEVRAARAEQAVGYISLRNRGFEEAQGDYLISLDDDAYFTAEGTVRRVVELFARHPRAAAVALPFIEAPRDRAGGVRAGLPAGTELRSYIGCAHAVRRQAAVECGKYRDLLVHQGEERDLCLRLLDRGYTVVYGDTEPIVHLPSAARDNHRISYYECRNTILFAWLNVPLTFLLPRMLIDSLQLLKYRFTWRTLPERLAAVMAGWRACWTYRRQRRPVSLTAYRRYRALPSHGPIAWDGAIPAPLTRTTRCVNT